MAAKKIVISPEVMDVLNRAGFGSDGSVYCVSLPLGLDRELYLATDKVLKAYGGKWSRKEKVHVFPSQEAIQNLKEAISSGVAVNQQQLYQSFYTPPDLAARMVDLAEVKPYMRVLEPSAGEGAIAEALHKVPGIDLVTVDIEARACAVLVGKGFRAYRADFLVLAESLNSDFDRVVMNPPFTKGQEFDHVRAAYYLLKPDGILVSVMSPSWKTASIGKGKAFREWVLGLGSECVYVEDLAKGTFKESGTDVSTCLVVIRKRGS